MNKGDIVVHRTGAIGIIQTKPSTNFFDKFYPGITHDIVSVKVKWLTGNINEKYKHQQIETVCNDTKYYLSQIRPITEEELKSLPNELLVEVELSSQKEKQVKLSIIKEDL